MSRKYFKKCSFPIFFVSTSKIFMKYFLKNYEIISIFLPCNIFVKYYKNIEIFPQIHHIMLDFIIKKFEQETNSSKKLNSMKYFQR